MNDQPESESTGQPGRPQAERRPSSALKIIKVVVITAAFLVWLTSPSWTAYRWSVSKRQWLSDGGWTTVHAGKSVEPCYPWTWIWPHTHSLLSVNLGKVSPHDSSPNLYVAAVMSFVRDSESGAETGAFRLCAFDTKRGRVADLIQSSLADLDKELAKPPLPDDFMNHVKWREADGDAAWGKVMEAIRWRVSDYEARAAVP